MATNGGGVLPNCQKQHKTKKIQTKILAPLLILPWQRERAQDFAGTPGSSAVVSTIIGKVLEVKVSQRSAEVPQASPIRPPSRFSEFMSWS